MHPLQHLGPWITVNIFFECCVRIVTYQKSNMDNNKWRERNKCRYCHNNIDSHLLTRPLTRYGYGKEKCIFFCINSCSYFVAAGAAVVLFCFFFVCFVREYCASTNVSSLSTANNNRLTKHPSFTEKGRKLALHSNRSMLSSYVIISIEC